MKKALLLVIAMLISLESFAFESRIHSIESSPVMGEPSIVKWENGRVSFIPANDTETLNLIQQLDQNQLVEVKENHLAQLLAMSMLEVKTDDIVDTEFPNMSYRPTVLESAEEAQRVHRSLRRKSIFQQLQFSIQCYNLAHVRAYEAFQKTGLKSMKAFLFFTDSYIREYGWKWWFHVTPMTYARIDGKIEAQVMDPEWSKRPLSIQGWTDIFMKNDATCPMIEKYSQYENHQEEADCYVFPVNMYFYQPKDLAQLEKDGLMRTKFDMDEVNYAYKADW